jgi:hypothetical protein
MKTLESEYYKDFCKDGFVSTLLLADSARASVIDYIAERADIRVEEDTIWRTDIEVNCKQCNKLITEGFKYDSSIFIYIPDAKTEGLLCFDCAKALKEKRYKELCEFSRKPEPLPEKEYYIRVQEV